MIAILGSADTAGALLVAGFLLAVCAAVAWLAARPLSAWLLHRRIQRLPASLVDRLPEEWQAELESIVGRFAIVRFALGVFFTRTRALTGDGDGFLPDVRNLICDFETRAYSSFSDRVIAALIDTGCSLLWGWAVVSLIPTALERYSYGSLGLRLALQTAQVICLVILPMLLVGGSPGKVVMGLRVVPVDGGPLTWRHAVLREGYGLFLSALKAIAGVVVLAHLDLPHLWSMTPVDQGRELARQVQSLWWVTGYSVLFALFGWADLITYYCSPHGRALHDVIAGTVVVLRAPKLITGTADSEPARSTSLLR